MALPFAKLLTAKPFVFVVGDEKKEFYVSQDAIAGLSPTLETLIKNDAFLEAKEGKTVWEDVDIHTFTRLCQFAYFGDYEQPKASEDSAPALTNEPPPADANEGTPAAQSDEITQSSPSLQLEQKMIWESLAPPGTHVKLRDVAKTNDSETPGRNKKNKKKSMLPAEAKLKLYQRGCSLCNDTSSFDEFCHTHQLRYEYILADLKTSRKATRGDLESAIFAGDVFPGYQSTSAKRTTYADLEEGKEASLRTTLLAHAKMYVLGDKWDVVCLKALSLQKLQKVLDTENLSAEMSIGPVLEVARFAFENTALDQDNLRGFMIHYLVAKINVLDLGQRVGFLDLMDDVDGFARAFWKAVYVLRVQ